MAVSIHVPRVNNNDDEVKLISLRVAVGDSITRGHLIAEVETDKAIVEVEAPNDGFVLGVLGSVDDTLTVGSILLWLGERPDEPVPSLKAPSAPSSQGAVGQPTAKARQLLKEHNLEASAVPASGDRLTAEDVERYINSRNHRASASQTRPAEMPPEVEGQLRDLRSEERGMLATVTWHRDVAVAGYIELEYEPAPWEIYAKAFTEKHKLLLNPLLSLMSWRLVTLAQQSPILNATIVGNQRYEYSAVNLGFTVQAGETLYLTVIRHAEALDEIGFVNAMGDVQRRAAVHKLGPLEIQGTTISFSSMARWKVSRHIPVLPLRTAIMIAHAVSTGGRSVLGASYDHRVLNGSHVVTVLRKLSKPKDRE